MSAIHLKKDRRTNVFSRDPLEPLSKEVSINLKIMEGTLQKIERIVISKPVEELRHWCSYMNLLASFLTLLMIGCVMSILYNPHRVDRLVQTQQSWHYSGMQLQFGTSPQKRTPLNLMESYDEPIGADLDLVIAGNLEWFDTYFSEESAPPATQEAKLANYKQSLSQILKSGGLEKLGNREEHPEIGLQIHQADVWSAKVVQKIIWSLEFSLIFVLISMMIAFLVAMRIYSGAMYFMSLRLNQQKNIRKLLEIENDQFYISKGLYWVCNGSMTVITILRTNSNLVPTSGKCHLYKLTHSTNTLKQTAPSFGLNFLSNVFNPRAESPMIHPCGCRGSMHHPRCAYPYHHQMPGYGQSPEEYAAQMRAQGMHPGMPGAMPCMPQSVHQNFVNVYSTNIVAPPLPNLRNRKTVDQYMEQLQGDWYVRDYDGEEPQSDPGTISFLDTENTSDKETVKKRGSQAGSRYIPTKKLRSGTPSSKYTSGWLGLRQGKKIKKTLKTNLSTKG